MPLDLFQNAQQRTLSDAENPSAAHLPSTFEQNFDPAYQSGRLFSQSVAALNARMDTVNDYRDEIFAKTGQRFNADVGLNELNDKVTKLKSEHPDLDLKALDDDELEHRAIEKSRKARHDYEEISQREKTWGGSFGSLTGSLASAVTDPLNIVALGVAAPESLGILGAGLAWGGIAGVTQAVNEAAGAGYREKVQPGYLQSGEPAANILESALGGAVLGSGSKALGAAWTRVKTGEWPRTVRDAGNVVESEAQIAKGNVLAGAEGEVAHREALSTALDQVTKGEPVEVNIPHQVMRQSRELLERLEGEAGPADELRARLTSEEAQLRERQGLLDEHLKALPEGRPEAAETLAKLEEIDRQLKEATTAAERRGIGERRDQLLTDTTPEKLQAEAAPLDQRRVAEAEQESIKQRLADIQSQLAQSRAKGLTPKEMTGQREGVPGADEQPHWLASGMSEPTMKAFADHIQPEEIKKLLASPEHLKAVQHDVEMIQAKKPDTMIPYGRPGEEQMRPLSEVMEEIKRDQAAADELENCLRPQADQAAEAANVAG